MRLHLSFLGETPHMRDGKPSVFKLPAWLEIRQAPGVDTTAFAQCGLGARTEKMTDIVNYDLRIAFPSACTHPKRWWAVPWSGRAHWGSHPQLKGTQWMVPWEQWDASMMEWQEPSGPLLTRQAAAYPGQMNEALAETWVRAAVAIKVTKSQASSLVVTGRWSNTLVRRDLLNVRLQAAQVRKGLRVEPERERRHLQEHRW